MKKYLFFAVATCFLSVGAVGTRAQQRPIMKVSVPFEFHFGQQTFPAGQYTVVTGVLNDRTIQLRSDDNAGNSGTVLVQNPIVDRKVSDRKLVFHEVGGAYFLAEIWQGQGEGKEFHVTPQEQQLAQHNQRKDVSIASN
jgi:hypothetical protein